MTKKEERDELDRRVMAAIDAGRKRLVEIWGMSGGNERAVDRSLQRLRKGGLIKYASKSGWERA